MCCVCVSTKVITSSILAPINKKTGAGSAGKSGAGFFGKNINTKPSTGNSSGSVFGSSKKPSETGSSKSSSSYFGKNVDTKNSAGKSSGSFFGSSTGGKSSGNKTSSSVSKPSAGFGSLGSSSSGKSPSLGGSSSYTTPKSNKSSTGFGIIWIPAMKRNKKKDYVYKSHNESQYNKKYERSPSMYNVMSGDSPDFKPHKKKEETDLLMPERSKPPVATASTAVTSSDIATDTDNSEKPEEKQEFIQRDKGETKDASGDTNDREFKSDKKDDYFNNEKLATKADKQEGEKCGDKVDSVYLRPPPPHKARSTASTVEEEDCGIKCLYYTLQCCDCVLM